MWWRLVLLALVMLLPVSVSFAAEAINAALKGPSLDLMPYLSWVETHKAAVAVERPSTGAQTKELMKLEARGAGPLHRWAVFGLVNGGEAPQDLVIDVPHQGFAGSGILWPKPPGGRVVGIVTAGEIALQALPSAGHDVYGLNLAPGQTAAIAFEIGNPGQPVMTLWQREPYEAQKDSYSFFRGALLGIAMLLAAAMVILYGIRSRAVFLAAAGFAFSGVGFIAIEAGHFPAFAGVMQVPGFTLLEARAVVEGLMAAFLILCLVSFADLRRAMPVTGNLILLAGGLAFALPVYGLAEPAQAAAIARMVFAATAVLGFVAVFILWRRDEAPADTVVLTWSVLVLWTFLAAAAVLTPGRDGLFAPLVLAGLGAVLVIMAFTLVQVAFSQGFLSRHFFQESGRRALALAGAQHYVWDWQPEDNEVYIGEEIERALDLPPGLLGDAGIEAFFELMHPADRGAYRAAVDAAEEQGRGVIETEFRLRGGDGHYRWFQLRGRAMAGHGRRAIRCIGTLTDVTGAKRAAERLLDDAVYDRVTGLPNRALFIDRLERMLAEQRGAGAHVLLIDIDRFASVNDGLGHDVGDSLLAIVGRRLVSAAAAADTVARHPGDQFAFLLAPSDPPRDAKAFAESLGEAVAGPVALADGEIFLTASIGVAAARESDNSAAQMLKDAAIALYEAKRRGAGTIEIFTTAMRDARGELVTLEQELRRAIERNEIEVHYQPIARLADMNLAGFEALARWRHPVLGLLLPESFIGLAEQTGMIRDIGRVVLGEAARQLGIWQRAFRPADPVFAAVNISSLQLIDAGLVDDVKAVLHREGIKRGTLKLEITESIVMQSPERAGQILERLKQFGIGLACDDFGTGYSSLSSLRLLPFDTLKLDKSFIATGAGGERAAVILEAVVAMAHGLSLAIVAEGIENQAQVDRLAELGCDFGQGYFIAPPMTAKQIGDALAGLPYVPGADKTALASLWERAAKDPGPPPVALEITTAAITGTRAQQEAGEMAQPPPPMGSAPMAPRIANPPPAAPRPKAKLTVKQKRAARRKRRPAPAKPQLIS
ncbi:MAG: putative bifunctional diguanylate cyclase/phosphodiesterase [Hyphomicrobiales bacterium]